MNDPGASIALRQLDDLADDRGPPRWTWAIVGLDSTGRILPGPPGRPRRGPRPPPDGAGHEISFP